MSGEINNQDTKHVDPKIQALAILVAICQEYVNVLNQTGKQVSASLVIQTTNKAIEILQKQ